MGVLPAPEALAIMLHREDREWYVGDCKPRGSILIY